MPDSDPSPIEDDEIILRRIPVKQDCYDPEQVPPLHPNAFNPRSNDTTGLSVSRMKSQRHPEFLTFDQFASLGRSVYGYHVAMLRVGDLRENGIEILQCPTEDDPGHAEIVDLTYDVRKSPRCQEIMTMLACVLTFDIKTNLPGRPLPESDPP